MLKIFGIHSPTVANRPAAFALASLVLALPAFGGEKAGSTTVFANADGSAWTVSVRPAQQTARTEKQSITVPSLPDLDEAAVAVVPESPAAEVNESLPTSRVTAVAYQLSEPPPELPEAEGDGFGIAIHPAPVRKIDIQGRRYEDAYNSIPYSQLEYRANPSYRHDAAMELLFGELRPTTIVRQSAPQTVDSPRIPLYRPYPMTPSEYWSYPQPLGPFFGSQNFGSPAGCVLP